MGVPEVEALYSRWLGWLETIENETLTLFLYRDYWRGLAEITQANPEIPRSTVFDAFVVWYASTQATSVRRQLDRDTRSVSFWRLLTELADQPAVMTRERHIGLWGDGGEAWRQEANENYDRFAGPAKTRSPASARWPTGIASTSWGSRSGITSTKRSRIPRRRGSRPCRPTRS